MVGFNLAAGFRNRIALPLYMELNCRDGAENEKIDLVTHEGQECDIVIKGQMKIQIGEHTEILGPGDSIYYDSGTPHGMIAVGGEDCTFYAIVLRNQAARAGEGGVVHSVATKSRGEDAERRIYHDFIIPTEEAGVLKKIAFKNEEKFNFAFDVVDALGRRKPDKLAMLHVSGDGTERRFTFGDIKKESARAANYF
jgi:acetyl-CoA synthetase